MLWLYRSILQQNFVWLFYYCSRNHVKKSIVFQHLKYDGFCWRCHLPADYHCCDICGRVYHSQCLMKVKPHTKIKCVCKNVTATEGYIHKKIISELISLILTNVLKENEKEINREALMYYVHFNSWPDLQKNVLLCKRVDVNYFRDKVHESAYSSTEEFFLDFKYIYHNCYIMFGAKASMTLMAQKFENAVKKEVDDAEGCVSCYINKWSGESGDDFFTNVCPIRHPIVWAKLKGFPFWPAKCLSVMRGQANVRFFGTHDKSLVPLSQVYKISTMNPGGNRKLSKNSKSKSPYDGAMAELATYVRNYTKQFGAFDYAEGKVPLDIEKVFGMDNKYTLFDYCPRDRQDFNLEIEEIERMMDFDVLDTIMEFDPLRVLDVEDYIYKLKSDLL